MGCRGVHGHGFMIAPSIGGLVVDLLAAVPRRRGAIALRAGRFTSVDGAGETHVI